MTGTPDRQPVTDEQRARAAEAEAQFERDVEAAKNRPRPPAYETDDKFFGPIGLDNDGKLRPPPTAEELAEREERIRRLRAARRHREER